MADVDNKYSTKSTTDTNIIEKMVIYTLYSYKLYSN